jgi:hypothetical protein
MSGPHEHGSEVVRLLTQISREYEAAQYGLSGLAQGVSRHNFITRRMEHIGDLYTQLSGLIGDQAIPLIAAQQDHASMRAPSRH